HVIDRQIENAGFRRGSAPVLALSESIALRRRGCRLVSREAPRAQPAALCIVIAHQTATLERSEPAARRRIDAAEALGGETGAERGPVASTVVRCERRLRSIRQDGEHAAGVFAVERQRNNLAVIETGVRGAKVLSTIFADKRAELFGADDETPLGCRVAGRLDDQGVNHPITGSDP